MGRLSSSNWTIHAEAKPEVEARCDAWIRKRHLQIYGHAQSRNHRWHHIERPDLYAAPLGSMRCRALGEGHLKFLNDRRGGYSVVVFKPHGRFLLELSEPARILTVCLHSHCPQRRLYMSRGDRTSSSPAHLRPIAAMVFSLPFCAALHRNAQPWLLSGRRRSSDRRRAVHPRLRPVIAPTDEWSQSGGCRPPW